LPDDGSEVFAWVPEANGIAAPTPIWLRVGGPRNRTPTAEDGAQRFELPGAVHGVVADAKAPPRFRFHGDKGAEVEFRVFAHALRSPLDAVLTVRGSDNRFLAYNDDGLGTDSVLRFTPPADGDYTVEVRDLQRSASPTHFFRLEAGPRVPIAHIAQSVPRPSLPLVNVPQGSRGAAVLQLQGVDAAAAPVVDGAPAGVQVEVGPRMPGTNLVPVLFTATSETPLSGALLTVGLRGADGSVDNRAFGQISALLTGRNDVALVAVETHRLPLAVTRPAPWQVAIEAPRVPLVRGGAMTLPVSVQRSEGYGNRLRVRPVFAPPGIGIGQAIVDANATAGTLTVEANADAPLGEFACVLTTIARVDGAVFEHALPLLRVSVVEPWVRAEPGNARTRQGRACELRLALTVATPAAAPWQATLAGLPRGATTTVQQVAVDATAVVFPITVAADAAIGRHRNLQVELRPAGADGLPVLHRFAAGELRIDAAPGGGS
jgi:hypothetical protein